MELLGYDTPRVISGRRPSPELISDNAQESLGLPYLPDPSTDDESENGFVIITQNDPASDSITTNSEEISLTEWLQRKAEKLDILPIYVAYALERTSQDRALADIVLQEMLKTCPEGGGENDFTLPSAPGIWTEEEDQLIVCGRVEDLKALRKKYGEDLLDERIEWLACWNRIRAEEQKRKY